MSTEKRILIAFLLSFVVLSLWSTIFPPPRRVETKSTQTIENKEVKPEIQAAATTVSPVEPIKAVYKEETQVLENSKIKVEFSNLGGNIKNLNIKEFNADLPVTQVFNIAGSEQTLFAVKEVTNNSIVYEANVNGQRVRKEYALKADDYLVNVNVQTGKMSNLDFFAYKIDATKFDKNIHSSPEKSLQEYSIATLNKIDRKTNAVEFNSKEDRTLEGEVTWAGFRNRYFCFILKPGFKTKQGTVLAEDKQNLSVKLSAENNDKGEYRATIYVGPQKLNNLASYNQGFEQIMVFSSMGILDICAKIIYFFLHFLQHVFKNWGVAIILLGISIFLATYPLTAQSMASMRKMQALQPKIKALQDKYKSNPEKLNKEMMEIYRENKVNPFGGCLPMLLQMPIFFGLYQVLWRSVDFKGASFFWIKDLSMPDRLAVLPINIPGLGNELNILPILMAIVMFFQQKFSSRNMVITDPNQLMQQKMMLVMMPVMMGFIFYHFASGLTLYFTVFYLLSTLMNWKMSKQNVVVA